jgi:hypothetical protein
VTKDELIDKYRDINVDYPWWEDTVRWFFEQLPEVYGANNKSVQWDGFWCQGSGASFEGRVYESDFVHFLFEAGINLNHYPALLEFCRKTAEFPGVNYERVSTWRWHECSVNAELRPYYAGWDDYLYHINDDPSDLEIAVAKVRDKLLFAEMDALEEHIQGRLRGKMRSLYHALEQEYEHLTSDEVVWDSIVANELHLDHMDPDAQHDSRSS